MEIIILQVKMLSDAPASESILHTKKLKTKGDRIKKLQYTKKLLCRSSPCVWQLLIPEKTVDKCPFRYYD